MGRELAREIGIYLESVGIDVLYSLTVFMIFITLLNYNDIKRLKKLKWNQKLWIGAVLYGLVTTVVISVLRIFGILDL